MTNTETLITTPNPDILVAIWKLDTALATIRKQGGSIPAVADDLNNKLQKGNEVPMDLVTSAYQACCVPDDKSLKDSKLYKDINRLGYLRYELLSLLALFKEKDEEYQNPSNCVDALDYTPRSHKAYVTCEIKLRIAIHSLLPEEFDIADKAIFEKTLKIGKGKVSNHAFTLIKIGRTIQDDKEKFLVCDLLKNQLKLIERLAESFQPGKEKFIDKVEKRILKAAHWQPDSFAKAKELYSETKELISLI